MKNFNSPYFSASIKEFWGRWHISLSTWFRDYVYIPLGGNRCSKFRHRLNLLITFCVSGLWHGAAWSYVIWGGIHGTAQIAEDVLKKMNFSKRGLNKYISMSLVFIFCNFAWIFFRASSIHDAIYILKYMFYGINQPLNYIRQGYIDLGIGKTVIAKICIPLLLLMAFDWLNRNQDVILIISKWKLAYRWLAYYSILLLIIIWGNFGSSQFVYFQF